MTSDEEKANEAIKEALKALQRASSVSARAMEAWLWGHSLYGATR
jgi:hypothetical protein